MSYGYGYNNTMKKQVRFGTNEEIDYEPTYDGGYAHTAVKANKLHQGENRRRTLEYFLRPDNFSIGLVVENPSGKCASSYNNEINVNDEIETRTKYENKSSQEPEKNEKE